MTGKMSRREREQAIRDFATLFNVHWYRDFPVAFVVKEVGRRAEWTTHIGICVRTSADLMGYFSHFEEGKVDAVIKDAFGRAIANIEWEWFQPFRSEFNELKKLREFSSAVPFSVLVTYSRNDHHEENIARIRKEWRGSDQPLLLFLVRFDLEEGVRRFGCLETYMVRDGVERLIRSQPALPWEADGKRWMLLPQHAIAIN
ncbi:hypothetical protein [Paraburkholderia tropica]|uniref:hypothetical protein n=1 Tax=Paraburkholderia tropica TaxID=92647 RepID=UPI0007ED93F0|nr:hypothetical protein [Paraburkholderia tropica]OBR53977.1 hypothetical protein A6456_21835 [Paraburkholderia tropica]